ncbi:LysR family transcriptional regulator [Sedimentibacter sp.]|uniref:LysR family transcriptional regulator n=1 Tax=Sedimentibacter sp. TaxID=1960295 RepID=UPI0028AAD769|nr:LysR family transcriptional regulator [Sedimentibacter sp.]
MNIEYLKTFVLLAETGSFSKTAKEQILVQSTVSSRISELEREVGQKLFVRNKNYSELTLAGKALFEYAEKIISLESRAITQANLAGDYSERLIIGTVYSLYDSHLCNFIPSFMEENEDVSIRVVFGHSRKIISGLSNGSIDIGYSHNPYRHPGYVCTLFNEDDVLFVTGSQNKQFAQGVPVSKIKELPVYYSNFLYSTTHNWIFPKNKLFRLDIDIASKIIPFLKTGESYTFLPRKIIEPEINNGSVIEIPVSNGNIPPVQNYIIYKKEAEKSNTVQKWLKGTGC